MKQEKRCVICGGKVEKPKRGPMGDYCGSACKQKAYRLRRKEEREAQRSQFVNRKIISH